MEPAADQSENANPFLAISKMLVHFAEVNDGLSFPEDNQLIIPDKENRGPVQRDGPGGRNTKSNPGSVMSLRTIDGGLFMFDHGMMVQKGVFEYHHISTAQMKLVLRLGSPHETDDKYPSPTLVPDSEHIDGTELSKKDHPKLETPTSDTVNLLGIEYNSTLALEYNDDPKDTHARLILIPEIELKQIMEDMKAHKPMIFKINPLIKIRAQLTVTDPTNKNNIALYFETPKYYYYIKVNTDVDPPVLWPEPVKKGAGFDPHKDFIHHLQFVERIPASKKKGLDTTDGQLDSVVKNKENGEDMLEGMKDLRLSDPSDGNNIPNNLPLSSEQTTKGQGFETKNNVIDGKSESEPSNSPDLKSPIENEMAIADMHSTVDVIA